MQRFSPLTRRIWSPATTSTSSSRSSAGSSRRAAGSCRRWPKARASSRPTRRCSPPTARPCTKLRRAAGVDLYYEASVAGAIPLLRPLRESLVGDTVARVLGIVNGTTNYILTRMDETGASFSEALEEATALGYAEADPTADIDGFDAASKAAIIASLAFHTRVRSADVYREGIGAVTTLRHGERQSDGGDRQAAGHRRAGADRERHQRARAPGDDPARPSAGRRPRGVQRGLRRSRSGRFD